jgi:HAAS domain-containing protein
MTAQHADQLIEGYLARLRAAAADLPPGARDELVADMRTHIAEARRRAPEETDATILNVLDRLGEPEVVAAEARNRPSDLPVPPRPSTSGPFRPSLLELAIPALLVFLWPIGIILLWYSSAWNFRDKLIGTVLPLGGYPWVLGLVRPLLLGSLIGAPLGLALQTLAFIALVLPLLAGGYMTYRLRAGRSVGNLNRPPAPG